MFIVSIAKAFKSQDESNQVKSRVSDVMRNKGAVRPSADRRGVKM